MYTERAVPPVFNSPVLPVQTRAPHFTTVFEGWLREVCAVMGRIPTASGDISERHVAVSEAVP